MKLDQKRPGIVNFEIVSEVFDCVNAEFAEAVRKAPPHVGQAGDEG